MENGPPGPCQSPEDVRTWELVPFFACDRRVTMWSSLQSNSVQECRCTATLSLRSESVGARRQFVSASHPFIVANRGIVEG